MAAEIAKLCCRQSQDFIHGEHVWVNATYFYDPKSAPENRFSASCCEDKKVYGVVLSVAFGSCRVVFDDGRKSDVAQVELNLIGNATVVNRTVNGETIDEEKDEEEDEENEDEEWIPEGEGSNSADDESNNSEEDERTKVYIYSFIIPACGFAPNFTCSEIFFSLS